MKKINILGKGGGYRFAVLTGKMTGGSAIVVPNKDKLK